jgi:dTDP-4-dehydrorhamnose reductase
LIEAIFDPKDPVSVRQVLNEYAPDVVINAVALTDVDQCEKTPSIAYTINARIVEILVDELADSETHFVQISTDHFYNRDFPQTEHDIDILNHYAASKRLGELYAEKHQYSTILRTNFAGRSESLVRNSFTDWVINSLKSGSPIQLADDLIFNPLSLASLSSAIEATIITKRYGLYNLGSVGQTSKYSLGMAIATNLALDTELITRVHADNLNFSTPRPRNMTMDVSSFERAIAPLPDTDSEIKKMELSYATL